MSEPGFIDHIGIGVPDLVAAKEYYDDLMSVLGLREWFETVPGGSLNLRPDGALATYWLDPHGFKLEAVCHALEELSEAPATKRDAAVANPVGD